MERLLARLERRLGSFALPNLTSFIAGGMVLIWILSMRDPAVLGRLSLDFDAVRRGELWRLGTFLFVPPTTSGQLGWVLLAIYFTWWVGRDLERAWGAFRLNVYYLLGVAGAIGAAAITGHGGNLWLNTSLLLAFATLFPSSPIYFIVIPIPAKFWGIVAALGIGYAAVVGGWATRAAVVAAFVNYLLFFGEHWVGVVRQESVMSRQRQRLADMRDGERVGRESSRPGKNDDGDKSSGAPTFGQRTCAICGAREADGADIRVCSCDKCGGTQRTLCLEHARNH